MTEDELFPLWRDSTGEDRERLTREFAILLTRHANAIVFLTLGKHLKEPVNEAVFRALTRADSFKGTSKFSTWFHSIVYRSCMNYVQKIPTREAPLDEDTAVANPEDAWIERIDFEKWVNRSTPKERKLVALCQEGHSNREVAELCGVSRMTVYNWRKKLGRKRANA